MVAHAREENREGQWLLQEKYAGVETPAYFSDLARLTAGEPLAYLIGHVPFLSVIIHLDSRPLIPRPETEYWTEQIIAELAAMHRPLHILDLCAGSGAIGVAVLAAIPIARVDFAEIDPAHHPTIERNIRENDVDPTRTRIFGGDLFAEVPEACRYDAILSNPPYIDPARIDRTEESVLAYEPHRALFGGLGGMEYIARIIAEAPEHLTQRGLLLIEHEPEQSAAIAALAESAGYAQYAAISDQWGQDRCTRLERAE